MDRGKSSTAGEPRQPHRDPENAAHKIHHSVWTQSKSTWKATIACNADYSMQCPYPNAISYKEPILLYNRIPFMAGNEIFEALNPSMLKTVSKYVQCNRLLSKEQKPAWYCMGQESKFTF